MDDETPDLRHLSEAEWLNAMRDMLSVLELTRASLDDSEVVLTELQAAHLAGEASMLRRILRSRGVNLEE